MADIFISYVHQDSESGAKIAGALAARGLSVWNDQNIRAGEAWMPELEKALTEARVLVLCVSPSFLASDWAQFEIGVALSRSRDPGVQVIPLMLRESQASPALNRFQGIDARNLSPDQAAEAIQKVVEASRMTTNS